MIRVNTLKNTLNNWPTFTSFESAIKYIRDNTHVFNNEETISIVDYVNCRTQFLVARVEMTVGPVFTNEDQ